MFPPPGLSSSNQKWRGAQAAQPAHQHYLTGQIVHHSPQYHCGVVDRRDRKGKAQSITVSQQGGLKRQRKLIQDGNKHVKWMKLHYVFHNYNEQNKKDNI